MDEKVAIVVLFFLNHVLLWHSSKYAQESKWVRTLAWVGFEKIFVVRLAPEYKKLDK